MKFTKTAPLVLSAALCICVMAGCSDSPDDSESGVNSEVTEMDGYVIAGEENVKLLGRTYLMDDTLWLALSGSGIDFIYTGKKLEISVTGDGAASAADAGNYARIAIYVDGQRVIDDMVDEAEKTYTVIESGEETTSEVQVIKLSECAMSTVGIEPLSVGDGASVAPAGDKTHKIEFIGDSITCGYGVDDEDENHSFSTSTEDVTKAYAYKTAQLLDADYSMFSISGYGVISGYTSTDQKVESQTIPQYYGSLGYSWNSFAGTVQPQSVEWDFGSFQPEAVVINLGTNDYSYCGSSMDKQDEFSEAYIEFIKQVRERNPDAKIFCTLGIMGQQLFTAVQTAVYYYTEETGDENIIAFKFDQQDSEADGLAADWHPTEATHEKAAAALSGFIKEEMGW